MFRKIFICVVSITMLVFSAGCAVKSESKDVAQIIYAVDSGPILPELQMHEEYTITRTGVELERSGKSSETQVFEGMWAFTTDEGLLAELFTLAEGGECAVYKRVESSEPPEGGDTFLITLVYTDGSDCSLLYDPGASYEGAEELLGKVREVIKALKARPNVVPE